MAPSSLLNHVKRAFRAGMSLTLLALVLWAVPRPALAQPERLLQAKVKTAYVFNFIKFVEWPALDAAGPAAPIRVCVIGKDPVADLLGELAGRQVKGHPLVVERCKLDAGRPFDCHILFISQSEQQHLPQVLQQLPPTGVLTVSDIARFSNRGGMVGFVTEGGKVKVEINLRVARQSSLKISAKLLEVATVYQ